LWDDAERARTLTRELGNLRDTLDRWRDLDSRLDDLGAYAELAREGEALDTAEVEAHVRALEADVDAAEISTLLTGKYDEHDAILSIHAGAGGTDAQDWAEMLMRMYLRWLEKRGFNFEVVDMSGGEEAGLKSATILVSGKSAFGYVKCEKGVHRIVRISPFDAAKRRHTAFAQVEVMPDIEDDIQVDIQPDDLKVDVYRSSGAGGQHVNKTESAVRLTHLPTGIVVACQNERSQHANRLTAMRILKAKIFEYQREEQEKKLAQIRGEHRDIAWGSQIRSYVLHPYTLVKDHRTGHETGSVDAVLDGALDPFIKACLEMLVLKKVPGAGASGLPDEETG
jgi:peptide chain release factor 2